MSAIYTNAGSEELAKFKERQQQLLEEAIRERKSLLGDDDVLEITASDIKEFSRRFEMGYHFQRFNKAERLMHEGAGSSFLPFLTRSYMLIGFVVMIGSFFYGSLQQILLENRTQFVGLATGAVMIIAGYFMNSWIKIRRDQRLRERRLRELMRSESLVASRASPLAKPEDY